jgi:hypothetical protein
MMGPDRLRWDNLMALVGQYQSSKSGPIRRAQEVANVGGMNEWTQAIISIACTLYEVVDEHVWG